MKIDYLGFAYASLVAVGGLIGFVKAGSLQSLIWSLIFGGILGYGAYRLSVDSSDVYMSMIASSALMILMAIRFFNTLSFMPAGFVSLLSFFMVVKLGYQALQS